MPSAEWDCQLYDIIRPGLVNWKKVVKKFKPISGMMDQIMNGNYAVDLGKELRFSLVGIQGKVRSPSRWP